MSIHAAILAAQLALAAFMIGGVSEVFVGHRTNAPVVLGFGVVQGLLALSKSRRRLGGLYTTFAAVIPLCEGLQIWLGRQAHTPGHVTLGLLIWAASLALLIRVWMPTWLVSSTAP